MNPFKRRRDNDGQIIVMTTRDDFTYRYRGYQVKLSPTGAKYSGALGRYSAYTDLGHSQCMSLPYELNPSAYGNNIGAVCERMERNLDKIIAFLEADRIQTEESKQRLREFTATDRRFQ